MSHKRTEPSIEDEMKVLSVGLMLIERTLKKGLGMERSVNGPHRASGAAVTARTGRCGR